MAEDKNTPQDPPDDKKTTAPPEKPAGPPTVTGVKTTPLKHPSVIALEKKVSELEDKTDTLASALDGVNDLLAGLKLGGPEPVLIKNKKGPAPATGGMFDELDAFIWGQGKA